MFGARGSYIMTDSNHLQKSALEEGKDSLEILQKLGKHLNNLAF
jgi:hypothetical protein